MAGDHADREHELKQRGSVGDGSSTHPTLASIPKNGEHDRAGPQPASGSISGRHEDDSFITDDLGVPPKDVSGQPAEGESLLGDPTSTGKRFRVLRPHAQGGIGKVSVAFDAELQREVALKQIKPDRADDADSRARFLQEAEVTGGLEHPGIVPVYGLGADVQGRPYYAMRFVRGKSLDEEIRHYHRPDADSPRNARARALELRSLLDRFAAVCHTIAYAHSRGVLHRDLKPANILLGPFNESLVVDWGLAKVLGRSSVPERDVAPNILAPNRWAEDLRDPDADSGIAVGEEQPIRSDGEAPLGVSSSTDTQAGTAFGTPAFMSPEQAEGRVDQLGPASDVYSLGAVLYTLLCGRAPFEYVWCDVTALIGRVRLGEFPPPRKANAQVPRELEAVCLKAMAMRPENRYASATDLAAGDRAMAGRRAGRVLSRASAGAAGAVGSAAQAGRRRRGRPLAHGGGRAVGGNRPGRPRAAQDRDPAARGRAAARAGLRESRITPPPRRGQPR